MADRDFCPIAYTMEKKVVTLSAHVTFGASGAPTLDAINSKGFLSAALLVKSFTATASSTASYTAVSDFTNLYLGMVLSGTNVAVGSTISASINGPAGTFTASAPSTGVVSAVKATGGYVLRLGKQLQNGASLDVYNKILGVKVWQDLSALSGAAAVTALAPSATHWFMIGNTVASGTAATGASITLMCGTMSGGVVTFVPPASGEGIYVDVLLCNSTAG